MEIFSKVALTVWQVLHVIECNFSAFKLLIFVHFKLNFQLQMIPHIFLLISISFYFVGMIGLFDFSWNC